MLENTRIFIKVVQFGSFSKAAAALKMPKSTVSRAISSLEIDTGTKLLLRTTRSLSLTAAGQAFFDACLTPLQTLEEAEKSLRGQDSIIAGKIKLTAPEDLGAYVVSPTLARLCQRHPKLVFEVNYSNEVVDLVRDGYDLAIRIGKLAPSTHKVRKAGIISLIMVASPEYLETSPELNHPQDLVKHPCLTLNLASVIPRWVLNSGKKSVSALIKPVVICNQMTSLVRMAREGAGIGLVPKYLTHEDTRSGALVHVLPDWSQAHYPVSVVSPSASAGSARLKLCSDLLIEELTSALV
jgi:LysR family transcriptional regulator for bpeEF and oprC